MQCTQVTTTGSSHADSGIQPLQIVHPFQAGHQLITQQPLFNQFLNRRQALTDWINLHQRVGKPLFEGPGPHGRGGAIQATQ